MTMISRVGFCEHCFHLRKPRTNQVYCVIGATGTYHLYYADRNGVIGFTPHIYDLLKVVGTNVVYRKICVMDSCGLDIDTTGEFWLEKDHWQRGIMTIECWNALQKFKDTGYKI